MSKDKKYIAIISVILIIAGIQTLCIAVDHLGVSAGYETNLDKLDFAWWYYVEDGEQQTYDELYLSSLYTTDFNSPFCNSTLSTEGEWWDTARRLYEKEQC